MSLTDILKETGQIALGVALIYYPAKELYTKYIAPGIENLNKEMEKHPEYDGCRIDGKEDKK
jgi:hypothetical protein